LSFGLAVVALLSGCESPEERADKKLIESVQAMISHDHRDPSATQSRDVVVKRASESGRYVCGEVNQKNALGGYVGFRKFIASGKISSEGTFSPKATYLIVDGEPVRNPNDPSYENIGSVKTVDSLCNGRPL
jgi:hypothetical protein